MIITGQCRMCGKSLEARCSDEYRNDPYKLLPMLTCNRCYDFRDDIRSAEQAIADVLVKINALRTASHRTGRQIDALDEKRQQDLLARQVARFTNVLARFHGVNLEVDPGLIENLWRLPQRGAELLSDYRRMPMFCRTYSDAGKPETKLYDLTTTMCNIQQACRQVGSGSWRR